MILRVLGYKIFPISIIRLESITKTLAIKEGHPTFESVDPLSNCYIRLFIMQTRIHNVFFSRIHSECALAATRKRFQQNKITLT